MIIKADICCCHFIANVNNQYVGYTINICPINNLFL